MSAEVWEQVYRRLAELIEAHRTTLIFVNTRRHGRAGDARISERLAPDRPGETASPRTTAASPRSSGSTPSSGSSTASSRRWWRPRRSNSASTSATSISFASSARRARSRAFLQRVGQVGPRHRRHAQGPAVSAFARRARGMRGAARQRPRAASSIGSAIREQPLDVLAQQIVAEVAAREWNEDELYALVRRAWPYRALAREDFAADRRHAGGRLQHPPRPSRRADPP